jgi:hypothetical protein
MEAVELRDPDAARLYILQGLLLQRVSGPTATTLESALAWALEIAASGQVLPPVGFVADLGQILMGREHTERPDRIATLPAVIDSGLIRAYEDIVLGKCFADSGIERAGHVVRRLSGRDQARAIAFVVDRFCGSADISGVLLSPAIIKSLIDAGGADVLSRAWQSLARSGVSPVLTQSFSALVRGSRGIPEVLTTEDLIELEHGGALADLGQRIGLRQVIALARRFRADIDQVPKPRTRERNVATQMTDDDSYPVGGFASISTRGGLESMLQTQLAYMEPTRESRPDLFDIKYLRDELLYYSRDENQFLRQRHAFGFAFSKSLVHARFKDPTMPAQRIIMTLAVVVAAIELLTEWLSADALRFDLVFESDGDSAPLAHEMALMRLILREGLANGTIIIQAADDRTALARLYAAMAARSQNRMLIVDTLESAEAANALAMDQFIVADALPNLRLVDDETLMETTNATDGWLAALRRLLSSWIE